MAIFDNLAEVNTFFVLTFLFWCDWYAPTVSMWSDFNLFVLWHAQAKQLFWVPPPLVVPAAIVLLYILMEISFFIFYKYAFQYTTAPTWVVAAVTFLLAANVAMLKQWIAIFMVGRRTLKALILLIAMFATIVPILVIEAVFDRWAEFGTLLPYLLFWTGMLYLNAMAYHKERTTGQEIYVSTEALYQAAVVESSQKSHARSTAKPLTRASTQAPALLVKTRQQPSKRSGTSSSSTAVRDR